MRRFHSVKMNNFALIEEENNRDDESNDSNTLKLNINKNKEE
jgi:hypothetical protein